MGRYEGAMVPYGGAQAGHGPMITHKSTGKFDAETMQERRKHVRRENLFECFQLFMFTIFIWTFTALLMLEQNSASSRLALHIKGKLDGGVAPLSAVTSTETLLDYLEYVFVPGMFSQGTDTRLAEEMTDILHPVDVANRYLGVVRMRQVRVDFTEDCQVSPMFSQYKINCFPSIHSGVEATSSYGKEGMFVHTQDPKGLSLNGKLGRYSASGYIQTLSPTNDTAALEKIRHLRREGYLGNATRALFVDFNIWNSNWGIYCVVTIMTEFGASGRTTYKVMMHTMHESVVRLGGLGSARETAAAVLLIVTMVLTVCYFIPLEIYELNRKRWAYFKDLWNIIDWGNMFLLIVAFVFRISIFVDAIPGFISMSDKDTFTNIHDLAERAEYVRLCHAFNAILFWAKMIKFLRHLPIVKDLIRTVWESFKLFIPALLMFGVCFIGFAMAFNIGFGDKISEVSYFAGSAIYLVRAFLSDVKLMPAYETDPIFGAILMLIFYVTLLLGAMNIILAIISDSLFREKYGMNYKRPQKLGEEEPLEEFVREVTGIFKSFLKRRAPWLYRKIFRRKGTTTTTGAGAAEKANGDNGDEPPDSPSSWQQKYLEDRRRSSHAALSNAKLKALQDRAMGNDDDSELESEQSDDEPDREELLRAIEHMSGRVLSEVSVVGIEVKSELHDVCERVAQMQMAVEELAWRTERVRYEQEKSLSY